MHYLRYLPSPRLRDYIHFFWTLESSAPPTTPFFHWAVASGSSKLVFQYQGTMELENPSGTSQILKGASIQAQTQRAFQYVTHQAVGLVGVYFHPGALGVLLGVPAHELTNQHLALSDLLGQVGKDLEETIILARSSSERIHQLTMFFENRLATLSSSDLGVLRCIQSITSSKGQLAIQALVDQHYLSQRQLERRFKTIAGFSPKLLSRIIRFEHSIHLFMDHPTSLTQTAYAAGYSDQSHFIRDVNEFAGQPPMTYFRQDWSLFRSE
ncbi:helix-turn-helix domain-containing protein [Siphonobacter sp. SORGH_AS_0500]|uniref:AraC family transcriptional regulator n=1 Tax=Siphonobacter sp. SORGH_AS_0500 TaxID=1864824 RepID=UPI00285AEC1D|nr:helix-turn-helix domain-containing protein [Siphonobacter sp. SORGH_AS_0500]MDR6194942.1 AraC-like DNA-binding protein [Siphonobacter sp. SORGH_AS_0500]